MNARRFAWFLAVAFLTGGSAVHAAEIKVLATIAVKAVMDDLVPQFERESSHKVAIEFGTSARLRKQLDAGDYFDVAIFTPPEAVDALVKQGLIAADSVARFAATRVGMAVRAGTARPDIATPETLKQALLAAKSVTHTDPAAGGTSGIHAKAVIERLGIANELAGRIRLGASPPAVADLLAKGEVELGFIQISEIVPDARLQLVGPLLPPFDKATLVSLGVRADSKESAAARALARFLASPAAHAAVKARGMEAPSP